MYMLMTPLGHTAVTALIAGSPLLIMFWGMVSHIILDLLFAEYRPSGWIATDPKTWLKYIPFMASEIAGILLLVYLSNNWWIVIGAVLFDAIEAVWIVYNLLIKKKNVWQSGKLVFPWHRTNKNLFILNYWQTLAFEVVMILIVLALCI